MHIYIHVYTYAYIYCVCLKIGCPWLPHSIQKFNIICSLTIAMIWGILLYSNTCIELL